MSAERVVVGTAAAAEVEEVEEDDDAERSLSTNSQFADLLVRTSTS